DPIDPHLRMVCRLNAGRRSVETVCGHTVLADYCSRRIGPKAPHGGLAKSGYGWQYLLLELPGRDVVPVDIVDDRGRRQHYAVRCLDETADSRQRIHKFWN